MAKVEEVSGQESCPLTPSLLRLLEVAVTLGTTNNKELAEHRKCSEETIKSGFRRINALLGTHSRSEAVLRTISHGWIGKERSRKP
ncbi:hypothetical protein [Armatimonas sp.]|uniref:hypothetical protein n=1 Tax=Armatimonas sp. TaxID=1872638 RepID=UPI00374D9A97